MNSFAAVVLFALLTIAAAAPYTEEQIKTAKEYIRECVEEHGFDPANVQKLKEGDFTINDDKAQCFTLCFLRKVGLVNENGDQNIDVIRQKLSASKDSDQIEAAIKICKNKMGTSPCNKAFESFKCYRELF